MSRKLSPNKRLIALSAAACAGLLASRASAVTYVWDGGGANDNWNTAANWVGDVAATDDNATDLVYTGTAARLTSINTANDFNVRNINFAASAGSYTLTSANGVSTLFTNGAVAQNSTSAQLFSAVGTGRWLLDQGSFTLTGYGTGTVTFGSAAGNGTLGTRSSTGTNTLTVNNSTFDVLINSNTANVNGGTFAITKNGTGTLTLRGTGTQTGTTNVNGGSLVLDYDTVTTGNRLTDTAAVALNGGDLRLLGSTIGASSETVGTLTGNSGKLSLIPGSGQSATFTAAALATPALTSSFLVRGDGLGGSAGTFSQLKFTAAPTLVGAGGTGAQTSIIASILGDNSSTGGGAGLVTYDPTNGVRLLDEATEYADYATAAANDNAKILAGGTISGRSDINALLLKNTSNAPMAVTIADGTNLAPMSGVFLFSGNASNPITLQRDTTLGTGTLNLSANTSARVYVTADTTATIDPSIRLNTTGALVKDGAGTLVLNQNITTTGFAAGTNAVIAINGGTLKAGGVNIIGIARTDTGWGERTVTVANGATFDLNGFNQTFASRGALGDAVGSIITNTGANVTLRPNGTTNPGANTTFTHDGIYTDGTPLDGAATGLISLDLASSATSNRTTTIAFSRGGSTWNNISIRPETSDKAAGTFTTLSPTNSNTVYGVVTLMARSSFSNGTPILTLNAVSDGTTVSKPMGDAPIVFTTDGTTSGNNNGILNINLSGVSATPLNGTTSTWNNDLTITGNSATSTSYTATQINLNRGDGVSANFTHQLDALTFSGAARKLDVVANNGSTLEFTGTTTLAHTVATSATFTSTAGTTKLNNIVESGTGAKGIIKSGVGTLNIAGTASYTGTTSVSNGTLLMNGSHTTGGVYNISAGTLGGTGTIGSGVNLLSSTARINPGGAGTAGGGAAVESLNVGSINVTAGALVIDVNVNDSAPNLSTGDLLINAGAFSAATPMDVMLNILSSTAGPGPLANSQSLIVLSNLDDATTPLLTDFNAILPAGVSYSLALVDGDAGTTANDLQMTITAVPEPTTLSLLGLGAAALLRRKRRTVR